MCQLGKDVKALPIHQSLWVRSWRPHQARRLRGDSEERQNRQELQDLEP